MNAGRFISARIAFRSRAAVVSIAVSIVVIIIAVAVAEGFRHELKADLQQIYGDFRILPVNYRMDDVSRSVRCDDAAFDSIAAIDGVRRVVPAIYRAAVAKGGDDISGVLFKGVEMSDTVCLSAKIPRRLADVLQLNCGDRMLSYFIGDRVVVRNFKVDEIYDGVVTPDDMMVVLCDVDILRRINGWDASEASAVEVLLDENVSDNVQIGIRTEIESYLAGISPDRQNPPLFCSSLYSEYPQLFDWLRLIDSNVSFILVLMIIVAALNMVVALLILLFENISTIGLLGCLGMDRRGISKVFLGAASRLVLKALAIGNALGITLVLVQKYTHVLNLDPENYFISFVPVHLNVPAIALCDAAAFAAIMLILLIPCRFISKVDAASTLKYD